MDTAILLTTNALLSSAAAIVMLVVACTRKTYAGFGFWTAGVACLALGAALLVPDALPPSWAIRVLRNALLLGGLLLILRGLLVFRGHRVGPGLEAVLGVSFLAVFGHYSLDPADLDERIVTYCAFAAALSLATAGVALWRRPAHFGSSDVLLALWMAVVAVLNLVRIVHQLGGPGGGTAFEALKGFGSFYAMAQILTVQLVTLTLISMNSQRIEAELDHHRHHLEDMVRERTAQLLEAQSRAEAANLAKSAFLANMSHEIRTPLHGLLGMAQRLLQSPLPAEQRQQAQVIERSGQLLLGVIDDVLNFSRIEAGRLELEQLPFDLVQLARDAVALFEPRAQAKGLALRLELAPCIEQAWRLGDPLRLSQILNNLLSNAVKFTAHGNVVLQLSALDGERWRVAVRDTGIGLSDADRRRIFEPFMQADSSTTRRFGGTGLGLAIVGRLVRLQGGELGVESEPGRGTEFWFELGLPPAAVPDRRPPAGADAAQGVGLAGRRALVAEDNDINMTLACAMLQALDMEALAAVNGAQAVQAYGQERPDVVLMDMHMPQMDGLEATRRIRALEKTQGWARTPIVALTASALAEDRQRCIEAGMDDVLVKPFQPAQLHSVLQRHCGQTKAAVGGAEATSAHEATCQV